MKFVEDLSNATQISEPALKLLLSILAGYPVAIIYRMLFHKASPQVKHIFNLVCGFGLAVFCYGVDIYHSLFTIVVTYALLKIFHNRAIGLALSFLFNIVYLVTAYYFVSSAESYDIDWTTAQSVLCLRLMSFAWDYFDGGRKNSKNIEADQKENGLEVLPPLVEALSFAYFYTGFFIGPQFTFRRYNKFITGEIFNDAKGQKPTKIPVPYFAAIRCFFLGAVYLGFNTVAAGYFPTPYLLTAEYEQLSFPMRLFTECATCYVILSKYLGIWLLGEGSSVLCGIGFGGYDEKGNPKWDGLSNVNPWVYETSPNLQGIVASFNINTNDWSKRYIFKRLKFLNNRNVSFLATILFLALWHGLAPGYFICFILEFLSLDSEGRLKKMTAPMHEKLGRNPAFALVDHVICQILRMATMHFAFIAFELKQLSKILIVWKSLYYWFFIAWVVVLVVDILRLGPLLFGKPKREEKKQE